MSSIEGKEPKPSRTKGRKSSKPGTINDLNALKPPTPSDRLADMTRERIDSLEADKQRLLEHTEQLQAELDRLRPENARINESLDHVTARSLISSVLVTIGGIALGFAAFYDQAKAGLASGGAAFQVAGILVLIVTTVRSRKAG